jgi:concanavalin A-like lectin/glucanase superfamily protein/PEP-CTERM motif-containing protein
MMRQLWILAGLAMLLTTSAEGAITHRYSFNDGTANDSVAGANGVLVGTNGSISGGQLILANTGEGSQNPGTAGAFLDLPNGIISGSAASSGAVTVEMWLTAQTNRDWAAAFTAGTSIHNENTADCCNDDQPYIQIIPRSGDGGQGNDVRVTTNSYGGPESWVDDNGPADGTDLAIGTQEHLVSVFDQSGGLPGTLTVYRNGNLMGSVPIAANLNIKNFFRADNSGGDVNIWLGRSQWPDSLFAGSYDELRIYNSALNAGQAQADFVAGPNKVVPEPSTIVLALAAGAFGLLLRRRAA